MIVGNYQISAGWRILLTNQPTKRKQSKAGQNIRDFVLLHYVSVCTVRFLSSFSCNGYACIPIANHCGDFAF